MALDTGYKGFIPKLWSSRLLEHFDNSLVALNLVTREYEGEISAYGDTVHINQLGDVTIKEYTGADIDGPEDLTSTQQTLTIDKGRYFNFQVKDVAKAQANVNLIDAATKRAAYQMADGIDKELFTAMAAGAKIKVGTASAPIQITPENAYDTLVDLAVKMNEANVPTAERKVVLPHWFLGMLAKDKRFTTQATVLQNGVVEGANISGMQVLASNNLKGDTKHTAIIATVPEATAFANQVVETEAYRPEANFADAIKGLNIYGSSVIRPEAVAVLFAVAKPEAGAGAGA